jgi:hypothetical protein
MHICLQQKISYVYGSITSTLLTFLVKFTFNKIRSTEFIDRIYQKSENKQIIFPKKKTVYTYLFSISYTPD